MNHARREARVASLAEANQRKSADAAARVREAVKSLIERGEPVNVHAVAREAQVARSFIYDHEQLLAQVRSLAVGRARLRTPEASGRSSAESLRNRLADALDRQNELKAELDKVKAERERLLAEVRSLRSRIRVVARAETEHQGSRLT